MYFSHVSRKSPVSILYSYSPPACISPYHRSHSLRFHWLVNAAAKGLWGCRMSLVRQSSFTIFHILHQKVETISGIPWIKRYCIIIRNVTTAMNLKQVCGCTPLVQNWWWTHEKDIGSRLSSHQQHHRWWLRIAFGMKIWQTNIIMKA